jgi:hypothetical protein
MPSQQLSWAAYIRALNLAMKRSKYHFSRMEKALAAASDPGRKRRLTLQRDYWQSEGKLLEMMIEKAEHSRDAERRLPKE